MLRKCGECHKRTFVCEGGDPVADGLGSFRRHDGPNCCANLLQGAARGFRNAGEIFVDGLGSGAGFGAQTATTRICLFHAGHATRAFASSLVSALPHRALWHYFFAKSEVLLSRAAVSARNFAACSGCSSASYSSARSLRAFTSQLTFGSICLARIS